MEPAHAPPGPGDRAAEFMPEHDRHVDRPGVSVVRLMHVGPAYGDRANFEQDIVFADLRHRDLAKLDGVWLQGVMDDGGMGLHRL
jgi:hypothetical protein